MAISSRKKGGAAASAEAPASSEKQDVTVSLSPAGTDRAAVEAARGIHRDEKGKIVLTDEQRKARVARLDEKIADFKQRVKNAEAEKKAHLAALGK